MTAPARFGIPASTAQEQLQKSWPPYAGVQPLPAGQGGRATAAALGIKDGPVLQLSVIGDHGGISDPNPQKNVAAALAALTPASAFVYSVGDIVYFNGDAAQYAPQFYEPYAHVVAPFVGIPGNHDGDTTDDKNRKPLDTFMANFCASSAGLPAADPHDEYGRDTQVQPWCDWTLDTGAVTIIGLYSNVPSGGHLEPVQTSWLAAELAAADPAKPVIVTLHHPPYSIDAHHGGSAKMGAALDSAFEASKRCADLVISGHVHDYQRFTRTFSNRQIPYVVIGNSGYHNLHGFAPGVTPGQPVKPSDPTVVYEAGDDQNWGFLLLVASAHGIGGEYVRVAHDGTVTRDVDHFAVSSGAVK